MVEKQRTCNHLLLLVGSNPLPNFLATLVFNPKTVRLFHSPETEAVKDILTQLQRFSPSNNHFLGGHKQIF